VPDVNTREDDVFGAASTLFGTATHTSINSHFLNESLYLGQGAVMSSLRGRDPIAGAISTTYFNPTLATASNTSQHRLSQGEPLPLGLSPLDVEDNPYALFDSTAFSAPSENGNPRLYRFGSDSHFASNGFLPSGPSEDAITSRLLSKMGQILEPIISAANSRPDSPVQTRRNTSGTISIPHKSAKQDDESGSDETDTERGPGPSKRRKSKHMRDNSDTLTPTTAPHAPFQTTVRPLSTPNPPRRPTSSSAKSPTKRRKPSPNDSIDQAALRKLPRENLSEEQKRSNHIQSEQKRRNLIKQGFHELEILVPELRSGGFSKSNMLVEAAKYLEELIEGNDALKRLVGEQ